MTSRTCFYRLHQFPAALCRGAFGRQCDGGDFQEWGGIAGKKNRLALDVIAMGGHNSVDVAQQAHEEILRTSELHSTSGPNRELITRHIAYDTVGLERSSAKAFGVVA